MDCQHQGACPSALREGQFAFGDKAAIYALCVSFQDMAQSGVLRSFRDEG